MSWEMGLSSSLVATSILALVLFLFYSGDSGRRGGRKVVSKYPASPTKYMYVQPARHPHKHTQKHNTASTCFWFSSLLRREKGIKELTIWGSR